MAKRLVDSVRVELHEEQRRRMELIDREDYSGVVRKVREFYVAEHGHEPSKKYLKSGIWGLKQYYAVALLDPLNAHAVSAKIDPFWHAHILHTQQYMDFCDRVVGRYMHHVPLNPDKSVLVENIGMLYGYTIDVLRTLFGYADRENWPLSGIDFRLCCGHAAMYEEVNEFALFEQTKRGILLAA